MSQRKIQTTDSERDIDSDEDESWEIDKLVDEIIDAYTMAPNDEDEKRDAVKATVIRSGWIKDASYC